MSPDTIIRWCKQYAIGKQLHRKAPWRVDPLGLEILINGDADALAFYRERDWTNPALEPYAERLRRFETR